MRKNMSVERVFTRDIGDLSVYEMFQWKKMDVVLKDYNTGEVLTRMEGLDFPEHYSQNACDIVASKYFRKKGIPETSHEVSLRQVVHRMVNFWVLSMVDGGLVAEADSQVIYDELAFSLLAQMWAPNSPQWFNTGLKHAYGISGSSNGHFYYDEATGKVKKAKDSYSRTQGSACFILGVADSLLGEKSLMETMATETLLFKYGSGVGSNWSSIRAKDEFLSGGGKSSGLLSFLKVSDRNAGAIKSGGTTRRAAKMNILDLDHPEVMEYIGWKSREEDKVADLGRLGYSTSMDGEAYDTVSGQNANNSLRIPDEFMRLLEQDGANWRVRGRVTPEVDRDIPAELIWDEIAKAAWRCGDPGVQYDDIINAWHTCPAGEDGEVWAKHNKINGSNPCSEYLFLDDTACNLASINVLRFYDGEFNTEAYCHLIKLVQMVLEATIHWGQFPTADIARKSHKFRTTGLGLTNLGALLMYMGLPYDSERARHFVAALCSIMTGYSYYTSAQMAEAVGAFECYPLNASHMKKVIANHAVAAGYEGEFAGMSYKPLVIDHGVLRTIGMENLANCINQTWRAAINHGEKFGYRNAQVSVLAPTGTIAFAMDCDSTSAEPFFSHIGFKKLVGGGSMVVENHAIRHGLAKLGYKDKQIDSIIQYIMRKDERGNLVDGKIEGAPFISDNPEHLRVFDTANRVGSGERFLSPEAHVKMLAALTPHITGAISKTVNLPRTATPDYIKEIYRLSWELGVKAVALYRDGSKENQPLNNDKRELYGRVKPRGIRRARVHEALFTESNTRIYVITSFYGDDDGELAGKLAEVFIVSGRQGSLTKGLLEAIGTGISKSLQHGMPAEEIASMYRSQIYEPNGMVTGHPFVKNASSISDLVSQIMAKEAAGYAIEDLPTIRPSGKNGGGRTKPTGIRNAHVHEARIDTAKLFVVASFYGDADKEKLGVPKEDAHLAEIFAFCGEQGTTVKGMLGSLSTTISISLQSGVPAKNIAKINRRQSYDPSGLVSGHPYIGIVSSVSDLISKVIEISYGDYTNCQIKPSDVGATAPGRPLPEYTPDEILYGEICSSCGSDKMVQSGVCKVCINCGTTTGCS
ncbi:MAG: vitamin B12-dependent ribonucleotide reductase [Clostridiales bacterium]|jgi:ribonucleoside-diphosphate reductase alpha chain|nr:vitamin B12-dependent ribonucleotide reductase [Clostridiales bacterium]